MNLTSQRTSVLNKEKGKAPMASSPQRNHAFICDRKISSHSNYNKSYVHTAYNDSHDMFASSSTFVHGRSRSRKNHVVHHVPRKMCNKPTTIFYACSTSFVLSCKNEKVVARKLGSKCKGVIPNFQKEEKLKIILFFPCFLFRVLCYRGLELLGSIH
jgi:hypothetical protein